MQIGKTEPEPLLYHAPKELHMDKWVGLKQKQMAGRSAWLIPSHNTYLGLCLNLNVNYCPLMLLHAFITLPTRPSIVCVPAHFLFVFPT